MGSGVELKPVLKIGHTRINERNSKFEIRAKHPSGDQFETKMLNPKLETPAFAEAASPRQVKL